MVLAVRLGVAVGVGMVMAMGVAIEYVQKSALLSLQQQKQIKMQARVESSQVAGS